MQRPQGISAHAEETPGEPEVAARLSAALRRLAALRARSHGDWSDGPATLIDVGNVEEPAGEGLCWAPAFANTSTPSLLGQPLPPAPVAAPLALRGRFSDVSDTIPDATTVDVSWLDLVEVETPVSSAEPPTWISAEEDALAAAINAMALADAVSEVIEIDDIVPAPLEQSVAVAPEDDEPDDSCAYGATAELVALFAFVDAVAPGPPKPAPPAVRETSDDEVPALAFGAAPDILALTAPITIEAPSAPTTQPIPEEPVEPALAVGAFALWFIDAPEPATAVTTTEVVTADDTAPETEFAFGAAPMLTALLDRVPAEDTSAPMVRAFDPQSLIDDALADAFDALLCAPDPIDPLEAAWAPSAIADTDTAALLASCETQLWGLPRHVPCAETFLLSPNHEIAVRITRALRVRANMLEARAFTDAGAFGALKSETDVQAFWFMADALADAASLSAGDADVDASFADWRMNDDGLIVVTAPDNAHPKRPPPLISEEELDALFAHVDDAQSRVVLDDLSDDPAWNETFWQDVDSYLEHVSETMDPALHGHAAALHDDFESHDIEVRSVYQPAPAATFFWMPGDDFDLTVDGEGRDLFIVGANETPAVVLVEDGSTYAMRTGKPARADEVIVSLSFDAWTYIDAMHWRRLATLTGVAAVRVEQNAGGTRRAVVAGAFFATTLEDDGVRLVLSGDEGDVDHPVTRVGADTFDAGDDWATAAA